MLAWCAISEFFNACFTLSIILDHAKTLALTQTLTQTHTHTLRIQLCAYIYNSHLTSISNLFHHHHSQSLRFKPSSLAS